MIGISGLFIFCSFFQLLSAETFSFRSSKDTALLHSLISEPFTLTDLSYESDVSFSFDEFHYLLSLKIGEQVTAQKLAQGVNYLFHKNLFEQIDLLIEDEEEGKKLQFKLNGFWRFEKIKVSGVWVGKEWYKRHYLMEPGDRFDNDKHEHSMQKIKENCREGGFFNITTESSFSYNKKTKGVTVATKISRGKRFSIGTVGVSVQADDAVTETERLSLQRQLEKKLMRSLRHSKYAKKLLDDQACDFKRYLAQRGFLHVSINLHEELFKERHAVDLAWTINVRKKRDFVFFGNRFFSSYELLDQILQFGRSAWIVPASILTHELQQAYRRKGFWNVSIDTRDEEDRSFFVIKEGERAYVSSVEFIGVHSIAERIILKKCFSQLKRAKFFDRDLVEAAVEMMIDLYLSRGFREVNIEQPESIGAENHAYRLRVTVDEGKQTIIDEISIPGYELLESQGPFAPFHKNRKPVPYNAVLIANQKRWLADHVHKEGYLFASIKQELIVKENGNYRLVWHIDVGNKTYFGKTIIQGNNDISFKRVIDELRYHEAELWDQEKLRQSFLRLKELNLFDSITFTPLSLSEEEQTRAVMLKLYKDDPFELRIRGGLEFQHIRQYQTFAGVAYKVGGTFMVKNPSNNGDLFRVDADVARAHREVNIKYRYPRFFSSPLDGLFHAYAIKYEQPGFIGSKKNIYTLYQSGFLVGLRHKNQYLDAGVNLGFEIGRTTFNDDDLQTKKAAIELAEAINFDPRLLNHTIPYFFFEPTILIDFLDNNLYPTKGTFSLVSFKGMFPTNDRFADSYFVKLLVEHSWFVSMQLVVAAFRLRFGHIFHRDFSGIMPNDRFYLGGSHSIRSYETDLAPPIGLFIDEKGKEHLVPRGGKTMINLNAEVRIPVVKRVNFVLFQDVGILCGDTFNDFCADKLAAGTGFGIRYHTPIGPLRFDIGWKWKKCSNLERSYNWILTFGQAF